MSEKEDIVVIRKNDLYRKANTLITAKYKSTITEEKILAAALAKISNSATTDENGNIVCELYVKELNQLFGYESKTLYNHLKDIALRLASNVIGTSDPINNSFDYISLVIRCTYKNGTLTIKFNGDVKEQLFDLKNRYTLLSIQTISKLSNLYSFRLYEILKSDAYRLKYQVPNMCGIEMNISLSELKLDLGIINAGSDEIKQILNGSAHPDYDKAVEVAHEQMMTTWTKFKRSVMDVAIPEINEKTDLNVSYSPVKVGRGGKVVGVSFLITAKEKEVSNKKEIEIVNAKQPDEFDLMDAVINIIDEKISIKDAKAISEASNGDMEKVRKAYNIVKSSNTDIDNLVGFIIAAIKNDYSEPVKVNKKSKNKADFPQNKYNFEELEETLLGN